MLLTLLGFGMVLTFMILIMTRRLSPLVALISIPIVFAIIGGFAPTMGSMMLDGIRKIAPTGVMLMFAILYFGVMIHAGLFDPVVGVILKLVKPGIREQLRRDLTLLKGVGRLLQWLLPRFQPSRSAAWPTASTLPRRKARVGARKRARSLTASAAWAI